MRHLFLVFAMLGCNNPLSNEVFYEDDEFLSALPDAERIGFPVNFTNHPADPVDPLLTATLLGAQEIEPIITTVTLVTLTLAQAEPSGRDSTFRRWEAVPIPGPPNSESDVWYVDAEIARGVGGAFGWDIQIDVDGSGPRPLASGSYLGTRGDFTWQIGALTPLFESVDLVLETGYSGEDPDARQVVMRLVNPDGLALRQYTMTGADGFGYTGAIQVDDPFNGSVQATMNQDGSGSAVAGTYVGEQQLLHDSCWNAQGETVYAEGFLLEEAFGSPDACP